MAFPKLNLQQREELAQKLGIGQHYIYMIQSGRRPVIGAALARQLNQLDPRFELKDLRPDDWQIIWPEQSEDS